MHSPPLMRKIYTWWLSDVHKPRPMKKSITNIVRLMSLALCWLFLTKEHSPCLKWPTIGTRKYRLDIMHTLFLRREGLGWCSFPLAKVTGPKCTCIGWCFLTLANANVSKLIHTHHDQCVQAFGDATFHLPKSFSRFPHVILDGWTPWLMMSTVRGRHLPEAQMSWMMVSVVGLSQYYPLDAHMTHVMHSCLDDVVWHCPI